MRFYYSVRRTFTLYSDFAGRSSRTDYWTFVLFCNVVLLISASSLLLSFLPLVIVMTSISIPGLSMGVRRLHDVGRSGWWMIMPILPLSASVAMIYYYVQNDPVATIYAVLCLVGLLLSYFPTRWLNSAGHVGSNLYGADPMIERMTEADTPTRPKGTQIAVSA